ncbi:putative MBF1-multi protein bridging factor mediates GCN4-dependent transcriptional activation [Rhodotorula diobovata]|uniref:Putative MBF1-multi protein bridging factor mediates GCN4-dependent transcriptional activation n=1 Tax=Rhodotorula diobovata TaxID=5288 RepID=A0A5C5FXB7_9BASI|nr:putative MBF1-multi protein bridging factor mediates GCN4-dependent transcriptional activation [Rhodotorula diobovata]
MAGSITDWDSQTIIGNKARGPGGGGAGAPANRPQQGDRKTTANKVVGGVDHAKIAKLDRENEVAPPPTVSLELGKVIQKARQGYVDSSGQPKPLSQGDLAKMLNLKSTIVQEYENMKAKPDPAVLGKMERILKVKLRGNGIGQPLGGPKKK